MCGIICELCYVVFHAPDVICRFTRGDVIRCEIDLDNLSISYAKNGQALGKAFDIPNNMRHFAFYPAFTMKNAELDVNFGGAPLKHDLPSYTAIAKVCNI